MQNDRVKLLDAAKELGCSPQCVREHMKRGIWDLGTVVRNQNKKSCRKYEYYIFRGKLNKVLGKEGQADEE